MDDIQTSTWPLIEMGDSLADIFDFGDTNLAGADSPENLFSILETLENASAAAPAKCQNLASTAQLESETDVEASPSCSSKRLKSTSTEEVATPHVQVQQRISHITVERNRRKQMNDNISVLRSLMPSFYVKRGDQASIIGGVVEFIKELQQVLQSVEAKKQRKVYNEVVSPMLPPPSPMSPRITPPLSPRVTLPPISPRTPQPTSPYKPKLQQPFLSSLTTPHESTSSSSFGNVKELAAAANSKTPLAQVEVKFSGPNVLLKTTSHRIPGQALRIIAALEGLSLEILHVSITTVDDTMINSFTIKIGIECGLSAEELAHEIQQTFC